MSRAACDSDVRGRRRAGRCATICRLYATLKAKFDSLPRDWTYVWVDTIPPLDEDLTPRMWWNALIVYKTSFVDIILTTFEPAQTCSECGDKKCMAQCSPNVLIECAQRTLSVPMLFAMFRHCGGLPWAPGVDGNVEDMLSIGAAWILLGRMDIVDAARGSGLDLFCNVRLESGVETSVIRLCATKLTEAIRLPETRMTSPTSLFTPDADAMYDFRLFQSLLAEPAASVAQQSPDVLLALQAIESIQADTSRYMFRVLGEGYVAVPCSAA